jgi:regulatory protein
MEYRITALRVQKRNPQRVNVYLDDEFAFGLARIVAAWLEIGQMLSDEKIAELKDEDGREAAYQQALRFLSYRPRSEAEVRRNLKEHEISEEAITQVIERLQRSGLLNDARFAQDWVENRSEMRPRSRRALRYELHQHGVDPKEIEQSIAAVNDSAMALEAARKQVRRYASLEWPEFRQKMYGFLARRGFAYDVSAPVTAQVWAEQHDTDPQEDEFPNDEVDL